jgi:hypothetical protein
MFLKVRNMEIKVDVYSNKMVLSSEGRTLTALPDESFSSNRLLIGKLSAAQKCLEKAVKDFGAISFLKASPTIIIQPHEFIEEGLSEVEESLLSKVAFYAGAKEVQVVVA